MAYQPIITDADIARVKYALRTHVGESNRIDVESLTAQVFGKYSDVKRRMLRLIIHEINCDMSDNTIVLTDTSDGGFWLADDDPEPAVTFYHSEESRIAQTAKKVTAMKHKIERRFGREALNPHTQQGGFGW